MRHAVLLLASLLTGCLEAADLVQERLAAPDYCRTPSGIALCDGIARAAANTAGGDPRAGRAR